jgi:hypothetical protein
VTEFGQQITGLEETVRLHIDGVRAAVRVGNSIRASEMIDRNTSTNSASRARC